MRNKIMGLIVLVLSMTWGLQAALSPETLQEARNEIDANLTYLLDRVQEDGSVLDSPGLTALTAWALGNEGRLADAASLVAYLRGQINEDGSVGQDPCALTYHTALTTLALVATADTASYQQNAADVTAMRDWLARSQCLENSVFGDFAPEDPDYGGFGYDSFGAATTAATACVLMAIRVSEGYLGEPLRSHAAYDLALNHFLENCRNRDGGRLYSAFGSDSYETATADGIHADGMCGLTRMDCRMQRPLVWLQGHFTSVHNYDGAGYYKALARAWALAILGRQRLGGYDWYQELLWDVQYGYYPSGGEFLPHVSWIGTGEAARCWATLALQTYSSTQNVATYVVITCDAPDVALRVYDPRGEVAGMTPQGPANTGDIIYDWTVSGESQAPGSTPPGAGITQRLTLLQPQSGPYRLELENASGAAVSYFVNAVAWGGGTVTDAAAWNGTIGDAAVLSSDVAVFSIVRPISITERPFEPRPRVVAMVAPFQAYVYDNDLGDAALLKVFIAEGSGQLPLHGVNVWCTDLVDENGQAAIYGDTVAFRLNAPNLDIIDQCWLDPCDPCGGQWQQLDYIPPIDIDQRQPSGCLECDNEWLADLPLQPGEVVEADLLIPLDFDSPSIINGTLVVESLDGHTMEVPLAVSARELAVYPEQLYPGPAGDVFDVYVSLTGVGAINWWPDVVQGGDWLEATVVDPCLGELQIAAAANDGPPRVGVVMIYGENVGNSPVAVTVYQDGMASYDLTIEIGGCCGAVQHDSGPYLPGEVIDLVAVPEPGYHLAAWQGTDDDSSTDLANTVTLDGDRRVVAFFAPVGGYDLTVDIPAGQGAVSRKTGPYSPGEVVELTATPDPGYHLAAWQGTDDDSSTDLVNTVTMDGNRIVLVYFAPDGYDLTLLVEGGPGTLDPCRPGPYDANDVVGLIASPGPGHHITGWQGSDDDASTATTNTVTMTGPRTVKVLLAPDSVSLTTQVAQGPGTLTPASGAYDYGTVVQLSANPAAGYTVSGWSGTDNDASTATANTVTMNGPRVVQVFFGPQEYPLTATVSGGSGTIAPTSGDYDPGTVVTLTATPAANYVVKAWHGTDNDASTASTNTVTMNGPRNVAVEFEPVSYNLTTEVVGSGQLTPNGGSYTAGAVVTLQAQPGAYHRLTGWSGTDNDAGTATTNTVTMNGSRHVAVTFEHIHATLTTTVSQGLGSVDPAGDTLVPLGATITLTATPAEGYRVAAWSGTEDDSLTTATNTVVITGDRAVSVAFELMTATLTTTVVGDGQLAPSGGAYPVGTVVDLTATPGAYQRLLGWSGTDNDNSTALTNAVTLDRDRSVSATFGPVQVQLNYEIEGGQGVIPQTSGAYNQGSTVPLSVTPAEGYRVLRWRGTDNDTSTAASNSVTLLADTNAAVVLARDTQTAHIVVKDGRQDASDTFSITVGFYPNADQLADASRLDLVLWSDTGFRRELQPVPFAADMLRRQRFRHVGAAHADGSGYQLVTFDLNRQLLTLTLKGVDLTGLGSPAFLSVELGSYAGLTEVDNSQALPVTLLASVSDSIRVNRASVRLRDNGPDLLQVVGGITAAAGTVELLEQPLTVTWGEQGWTIPAGSFQEVRPGRFLCRNVTLSGGALVAGVIDFEAATFTLKLTRTEVEPPVSPWPFGLSCGDFVQSVDLECRRTHDGL